MYSPFKNERQKIPVEIMKCSTKKLPYHWRISLPLSKLMLNKNEITDEKKSIKYETTAVTQKDQTEATTIIKINGVSVSSWVKFLR